VSPASDPFSAGRFRLRALNGSDEFLLDPTDTHAANALLRRLVVQGGDIGALTIADYDRLLAAVFEALYGDQVEARTQCTACSEPLEISLSLSALAAAAPDIEIELAGPDESGTFALPDGRRIRAPTVGDVERAVRSGDVAALRRACVVEGDADADPESLDAALEAAAPALTRDVAATCPHCAASQAVRFDLANFLIASLARERPFLLREMHLLARAYGWSLTEILSLSRDDRRALARLCEAERAALRRAAA
jgi:hypothetical protein